MTKMHIVFLMLLMFTIDDHNAKHKINYNKHILNWLLMPKIIAPKRTSKNVSVEDFWAIREQFRKQK